MKNTILYCLILCFSWGMQAQFADCPSTPETVYEDWANRIRVYRYVDTTNGRFYLKGEKEPSYIDKSKWSFVDWVQLDDCRLGDGQPSLKGIVVADANDDGLMEYYVTYMLFPDVTDCCYPSVLKTLVYEGNKKYAIRGTTIVEMDGRTEGGKMEWDGKNSLLLAHPAIQSKAKNIFRSYLR